MMEYLNSKWGHALLSTFIISMVPNVLLFFIPIDVLTKPIRGVLVRNILMCFAAGGLLGDVFLHTLPHLILPHSHSHDDHDHGHHHSHHHHHHHHHDLDHGDHHVQDSRDSAHAHAHAHAHEDSQLDFVMRKEELRNRLRECETFEDIDLYHKCMVENVATYNNINDVSEVGEMGTAATAMLPPGHPPISPMEPSEVSSAGCDAELSTWESMMASFTGAMTNNRALTVGCLILIGFLLFLIAERLASHSLGHAHSVSAGDSDKPKSGEVQASTTNKRGSDEALAERGGPSGARSRSRSSRGRKRTTVSTVTTTDELAPSLPASASASMFSGLSATGWINLLADSMHNFTDGIAIGAAYSLANHSTGGGCPHAHAHEGGGHSHAVTLSTLGAATALSVLLHEIPHEIGDFLILVKSGMSKWQAIRAQFVTALAAFAGTLIGLLFGEMDAMMGVVFLSVTAGGFLYISTVGMLSDNCLVSSGSHKGWQTLWDAVGFSAGVAMMAVVAAYE